MTNWSSDMGLVQLLKISEISDIKKSNSLYILMFYRPNVDPNEVHSVETILKDIIDVRNLLSQLI